MRLLESLQRTPLQKIAHGINPLLSAFCHSPWVEMQPSASSSSSKGDFGSFNTAEKWDIYIYKEWASLPFALSPHPQQQ